MPIVLRLSAVTELLPESPYHPDPVATGVIMPSRTACTCCGQERGYVYKGPVYTADEPGGPLCPWCIADGSAAERIDAHFTAGTRLGDDVPLEVFAAADRHTPGFTAWQEPQWIFHCGDSTAFLAPAGSAGLAAHPEALETVRQETNGWGRPPDQLDHFPGSLDKDGETTAYLFRYRVCTAHLAYTDFAQALHTSRTAPRTASPTRESGVPARRSCRDPACHPQHTVHQVHRNQDRHE
ncbi:CbrC family protein [Streptomyces sp. NPDC058683]|uniref:CbrC family protein n=1 Tax=Streptomyces sp. NPDC058683 TaxID=3346597 RepID=UPI00364AE8ED